MKHQGMKDRMHEREGMMDHKMHRSHMGHEHGQYRNEVERPTPAAMGHEGPGMGAMPGMGCHEFKGEADPIAYGQAGGPLAMADEKKIHGQFKDYHWD